MKVSLRKPRLFMPVYLKVSGFLASSRQRMARSRAVVTSGSWPSDGGRPCTEWKRLFFMPRASAFWFIRATNPSLEPATWVARATAASLADWTMRA